MNVLDKYKGLSREEIRSDLDTHRIPFAACVMNVSYDRNFGTIVRNANFFGLEKVFYFGPRKKWDKRSAVGAYNYIDVVHVGNDIDGIIELRKLYPHFIAIDILEGISTDINDHEWEPGTLLFFGEEGIGLGPEILGLCEKILHIPARGSVRSINVAVSSGIVFNSLSGK